MCAGDRQEDHAGTFRQEENLHTSGIYISLTNSQNSLVRVFNTLHSTYEKAANFYLISGKIIGGQQCSNIVHFDHKIFMHF